MIYRLATPRYSRFPMQHPLRLGLLITALATQMLVLACVGPVSRQPPVAAPSVSDAVADADQRYAAGDYNRATELYLQAADRSSGTERQELLLKAAESSLRARRDERAIAILDRLDSSRLNQSQRRRANGLRADAVLMAGRPEATEPGRKKPPPAKPKQPFSFDEGESDTVALVLPLSGQFAGPAAAVRDGFLTAHYSQPQPRPRVRIYDSTESGAWNRILSQAAADKADVIVGPLDKPSVRALADAGRLNIPVLALNYADTEQTGEWFYQFGLAPEDEAAAAARRALLDGRARALALVPNTEWGERILRAFRESLLRGGGELVDFQFYESKAPDYSQPVKEILRYQPDDQRPIREDADFLFLAANATQARQIKPQLRYYRAGRLPVYATSHVYETDSRRLDNQELEGIVFCDMPWVLEDAHRFAAARNTAQKLWPQTFGEYERLFALGNDAYWLMGHLRKRRLGIALPHDGATGRLQIDTQRRVQRQLSCARFERGRVQPLL